MPKYNLPVSYSQMPWYQRKEVREQYVKEQEGNCHYCKAPLEGAPEYKVSKLKVTKRLYPPNFFKNPVHLHHDHATDLTIGAVHSHCNAVLWEYEGE